jgi:hypothetical protein
MRMLRLLASFIICGVTLSACVVTNPPFMRKYLCHTYELKQDMYVCQVQYRYPAGSNKDRYFMRDPHGFSTLCEDSIYNLAYRDKPSVWPQGHGDFREKEWLIAKLPKGTHFQVTQYDVPNDGSQAHSEAFVTITSGRYRGLQAEWEWFDFTREIDRPQYFPEMRG